MKKIYIISALLISVNLSSQTIEGDNEYVIAPQTADSSGLYFLIPTQALISNSDDVLGVPAVSVDTNDIFQLIDDYGIEIELLPDTGIVQRNEMYNYEGEYCRIVQSHDRSTVNHYDPHDVPALYLFRAIGCPEWVQPTGAHDAYNIGDCVTFNSNEYVSLIDANVWSPSVYPAGWELQ